MVWRDAVRCPLCSSKSEVATGKPPERWRKCLNRRCGKTWRTREVFQAQANELSSWYTDHVESRGAGWGPLLAVAMALYDRSVELGVMLGVLREVTNGQKRVSVGGEPTSADR